MGCSSCGQKYRRPTPTPATQPSPQSIAPVQTPKVVQVQPDVTPRETGYVITKVNAEPAPIGGNIVPPKKEDE